jgi:hypothetical protein
VKTQELNNLNQKKIMTPTISYGLTVCTEDKEINNLLYFLDKKIDNVDEIVVVYDENKVTKDVMSILTNFKRLNYSYHPFNFKNNFLENKNYMNSLCKCDYIFQIDADEIPEEFLLDNIKLILQDNQVDLIICPRKNIVLNITEDHIKKWNWNINQKGWINWPDQQKRIYKNRAEIKWTGHKVHGMVSGYKTYTSLPIEEEWSIIHNKHIERQEKQNKLYETI